MLIKSMLEEGEGVVYDIIFFLERKERIKNFENTTLELDKDERDLFVGLLRSKGTSERLWVGSCSRRDSNPSHRIESPE